MNFNKLTKAELISKIEQLKKEKLDIKNKNTNKIIENNINENNTNNISFYTLFLKIKALILSLTIIGILTQVFKNYKSVKVILKAANYIIIGIFGMSLFDAFGLGFLVKLLGEFKYILGSIVTYLTDTTFYNYLTKIFNVIEEKEKESIRDTYKKTDKIDWKAEFEKAERQREIDKWKAKYEKHNEDGVDKKTIILVLLLLGGSIATWYYGKEALDIISPLYNISNIIKQILRGKNPGDDDEDSDDNDIELNPESRSVSPEMLVYASDMVNSEKTEQPIASSSQAAPPAPPIPPTNPGIPNEINDNKPPSLLDSIKQGKSLRKTKTVEKDGLLKGKEVFKKSNPLIEAMSTGLDKMRVAVIGAEDEGEISTDLGGWGDNESETTPTQSLDKGKNKIIETENLKFDDKNKFLDAISRDEDEKLIPSSKIADVLKPIMEKFPNISQETLEKLSTPEGLRNRQSILDSLSDDELKKEISSMSKDEVIKMDKIIKATVNLDSEKVVEKLSKEFPDYNFSTNSYNKNFMQAMEEEIASGKTPAERDKIRKEILEADLVEIQNTGGTSSIKEIKNVIRENYTHNSLLNSIKNRNNLSSTDIEADVQVSKKDWSGLFSKNKENASDSDILEGKAKITQPFSYVISKEEQKERGIENIRILDQVESNSDPVNISPNKSPINFPSKLTQLINKGKNLQTLEDLKLEDRELFEYESLKVKPDILINNLKDLPDYAENSYVDKVITQNIDENIKNMIAEFDGKVSKQHIIEKLLLENPNHKDKILSVVGKTFDEQLEFWENKFSVKDFSRLKRGLAKEDLKELQELGEYKTIDQIKTVATINKSHINLLNEIKTKASLASLRNTNIAEKSIDNTSTSIDQIDNTMNLFE